MRKATLIWTVLLLAGFIFVAQAQQAEKSTATEDISGMYSFLRDGEFVQINVEEDHQVSGFISRYGDRESDKGQFLDQFFDKASFEGNHLTFSTKYLHGVAFEFDGIVQRGKGEDRDHEAYLVLKGKLTQHRRNAEDKEETSTRDVEFKSFPADLSKLP